MRYDNENLQRIRSEQRQAGGSSGKGRWKCGILEAERKAGLKETHEKAVERKKLTDW